MMIMNKKSLYIVLLLLLITLIALQIYIMKGFEAIPGRVEIAAIESTMQEELLKAAGAVKEGSFLTSYVKEGQLRIDNNHVTVYMTDEEYPSFADFEVLKGKWFTEGKKEAVISQDLSIKLFATPNGVGEKLLMDEQFFEVVGVYETNKLLEKISRSSEAIYIPLGSGLGEKIEKGRLLIASREGININFLKEKFLEELSLNQDSFGIEDLVAKDMTRKADIIRQLLEGYVFAIELLALIFLIRWFVNDFKAYIKKYNEVMKKLYLREMLTAYTTELLIIAIKWVLIAFGCIFLLQKIIAFQFYIPGNYLPPDYILDFQFYKNIIFNHMSKTAGSYYEGLYRAVFTISKAILIVETLVTLTLYVILSQNVFSKKGQNPKAEDNKMEVEAWLN